MIDINKELPKENERILILLEYHNEEVDMRLKVHLIGLRDLSYGIEWWFFNLGDDNNMDIIPIQERFKEAKITHWARVEEL